MPLSKASNRKPIHTRRIECFGYIREDGLWDIEGHMTDVKSYDFANSHRGDVRAGEAVHDMWIRITVDDTLMIHKAEASTDLSPYNICPDITPAYEKLAGIRIGSGWLNSVKKILGGVHGCVHLTELLGPMATTAFQTAWASNSRGREIMGLPKKEEKPSSGKPALLNTCHAYNATGPVVKEFWPDHAESNKP